MSWQTVAIILGCVWLLPVMYFIKWYYMNKMFSRQNLQGLDLNRVHTNLLAQAGELDPIGSEERLKPYTDEGETPAG